MLNGEDYENVMNEILSAGEFADVLESEGNNSGAEPAFTTVIAEDAVIRGDIVTHSDLDIRGSVEGNIKCEGSVTLYGNIRGNLESNSLSFIKGTLVGNVAVREQIRANEETEIQGDISAESAELGGQLKGTSSIENNIVLHESVNVVGDIKAGGISVSVGAKLSGKMTVGETTMFTTEVGIAENSSMTEIKVEPVNEEKSIMKKPTKTAGNRTQAKTVGLEN